MTVEINGRVLYDPQPRQQLLHETVAKQILYGGAAGGGKSHSIRWDLIQACLANPGCKAYLFRRTRTELEQTHIQAIKEELGDLFGTYAETRNSYEFTNGSIIYMCYCEQKKDLSKYLSAEMHIVGIDEASTFDPDMLQFLKTRLRLGKWKPQGEAYKPQTVYDSKGNEVGEFARLPRFVMGSNPGGPGHSYLKLTFIDAGPPEKYFHDKEMRDPDNPDDKGWLSIYIPAKIEDNKHLDKDYAASFGGLSPELARAYRKGDWDVVVGAAIHNLDRDRHMLRQFTPPRHWTRFQVIDWGTASPFSVGWYCVSEGAFLEAQQGWQERYLPAGAIIRYREWYGWNGKPNKGCRLPPQKVARGIVERETDEVMDYRVADNEMWAQKHGPSAMNTFLETDPRLVYRRSIKDRKRNYQEVLSRLAGNEMYMEDGELEEHPMFFCTQNCTHFWRTIPTLQIDEIDHEKGPGDKASDENHVYDEVAYACRSQPYVTTEEDRYMAKYGDEIRKAKGGFDPYSTR